MGDKQYYNNGWGPKGSKLWFMDTTSIGGLAQYRNTDWTVFKVWWIFLFLLGTGFTCWNVWVVFKDFFNFPVDTSVTKQLENKFEFPAVTLCNLNKVHCSNLHDHILKVKDEDADAETVPEGEYFSRIDILCGLYKMGRCDFTLWFKENFELGEVTKDTTICDDRPFVDAKLAQIASFGPGSVYIVMQYNSIFATLSEEDATAIAQQPEQMVKSCMFSGSVENVHCQRLRKGAKKVITPNYGVCYSFNYFPAEEDEDDDPEPAEVSLAGESYGLELELSFDSLDVALRGVVESWGFRMVLHESSQYPLTSSQGRVLSTNTWTKLSLSRVYIERQPFPYPSDCVSNWDDDGKKAVGPIGSSKRYQSLLCQSYCVDSLLQNRCNCTIAAAIEVDRKVTGICDLLDPVQGACLEELDMADVVEEASNDCSVCKPQCEEILFQVDQSHAVWPSASLWPVLSEKYGVMHKTINITEDKVLEDARAGLTVNDLTLKETIDSVEGRVKNNFAKVQIFFESKVSTQIVESRKYEFETLMTSLGGALSLCLGISLVSVFEIMEFLLRLCGCRSKVAIKKGAVPSSASAGSNRGQLTPRGVTLGYY